MSRKPTTIGFTILLTIGLIAGCQSTVPPAPTEIPTAITATITLTATTAPSGTPTVTANVSATPGQSSATFRPMSTATHPLLQKVTAQILTSTATPKAFCIVAQSGDTLLSLLFRGGYENANGSSAFRQLNGMPPDSNVIVVGQSYCIPPFTPTPTPLGFEQTQQARVGILPTTGPTAPPGEYIVVDGDSALTIEIKTEVALSVICALNPLPDGINCAGCDLSAPIFQAKCRPIIRVGQHLKIPGPTPTPSLTPTLSGSETATPTLAYRAPAILSPPSGGSISGSLVRLEWISLSLRDPNDTYLILLSETGGASTRNIQLTTRANSIDLNPVDLPTAPGTYQFYWQMAVAHVEPDGSLTVTSDKSTPYSFTYTP